MYYDLFQEKKIFLDLKLMNHMIVIADESALKRIFNNLVSNIVKYGKSKAQIKSYSKDNYIIFTFKNDTNENTSASLPIASSINVVYIFSSVANKSSAFILSSCCIT